jgi:hypothetical protein
MKDSHRKITPNELQIPLADFLKFYNSNLPIAFPKASAALLKKYKKDHEGFFKHGELWSLDLHRKKILDWLPYNLNK